VIQFIIATVLIISTLIVGQQLQYIRSKALGYDKENIFQFGIGSMGDHVASVMDELRAIPGILSVSTADQDLVHIDGSTGDVEWEGMGKDESMIVHPIRTDKDYLAAMKIKLATGRYFSGSPADSAHYVINETMAKMMGMKDPVGKRLKIWQTDGEIIGVVKDFHYSSLHEKIGPLVMLYRNQNYRMYVRTKGKDAAVAIAAAKRLYSQYNGEYPFSYNFLDDSLDQMYKTDQRTGKLFNYFAGIAIFISCLGLFGLATFATSQRIKEIGVRKVLGASITNIITLLTADFLKIVLIAILLAVPIAWFTMNRWLEDYAYRVGLQWWVFAIAGILAIMIALFTVSFQSIKAALTNPVKSLKTE
jgi:ABC-type antimicrobial peptide transport system permease subunit